MPGKKRNLPKKKGSEGHKKLKRNEGVTDDDKSDAADDDPTYNPHQETSTFHSSRSKDEDDPQPSTSYALPPKKRSSHLSWSEPTKRQRSALTRSKSSQGEINKWFVKSLGSWDCPLCESGDYNMAKGYDHMMDEHGINLKFTDDMIHSMDELFTFCMNNELTGEECLLCEFKFDNLHNAIQHYQVEHNIEAFKNYYKQGGKRFGKIMPPSSLEQLISILYEDKFGHMSARVNNEFCSRVCEKYLSSGKNWIDAQSADFPQLFNSPGHNIKVNIHENTMYVFNVKDENKIAVMYEGGEEAIVDFLRNAVDQVWTFPVPNYYRIIQGADERNASGSNASRGLKFVCYYQLCDRLTTNFKDEYCHYITKGFVVENYPKVGWLGEFRSTQDKLLRLLKRTDRVSIYSLPPSIIGKWYETLLNKASRT